MVHPACEGHLKQDSRAVIDWAGDMTDQMIGGPPVGGVSSCQYRIGLALRHASHALPAVEVVKSRPRFCRGR